VLEENRCVNPDLLLEYVCDERTSRKGVSGSLADRVAGRVCGGFGSNGELRWGVGGSAGPGAGGSGGPCEEGAITCANATAQVCKDGVPVDSEVCAAVCEDGIGCLACRPGTSWCDGQTVQVCDEDGSVTMGDTCDAEMGFECDPVRAHCVDICSPERLGTSQVGCDYYAVITPNPESIYFGDLYNFSVAISNTSETAAYVEIDGGALTSTIAVMVPPKSISMQSLALVEGLGDPGSARVDGGAYHIVSKRPVTVHQFSPVEVTLESEASLLLPSNAMTPNYMVLGWREDPGDNGIVSPGFFSVVGTEDDTTVTITPKADVSAGPGVAMMTAGVPQDTVIDRGTVLQLTSIAGDLTGSRVKADKPVQVVAGHYVTYLPTGNFSSSRSHIEESNFPLETLGKHYVVAAPAVVGTTEPRIQIVRILAVEEETHVSYDPPVSPDTTLGAGEHLDIVSSDADFVVSADKPIAVAQYLVGEVAGADGTGSPAMSLAVASAQFRNDYLFYAPTLYAENHVNIVGPIGAKITLDGEMVGALGPVGSSGYGAVRALLGDASGNGFHTVSADVPVGIGVYGYSQGQLGWWATYFYPGGLDLTPIYIPPS